MCLHILWLLQKNFPFLGWNFLWFLFLKKVQALSKCLDSTWHMGSCRGAETTAGTKLRINTPSSLTHTENYNVITWSVSSPASTAQQTIKWISSNALHNAHLCALINLISVKTHCLTTSDLLAAWTETCKQIRSSLFDLSHVCLNKSGFWWETPPSLRSEIKQQKNVPLSWLWLW